MSRHRPDGSLVATFRTLTLLLAVGYLPDRTKAAADVCLLKLPINSKLSNFTVSANMLAPTSGQIKPTKAIARGYVFLRVPTASCPPSLTSENAANLLQQASLEVPIGASSISLTLEVARARMIGDDSDALDIADIELNDWDIGLSGNEPLGDGSVAVGEGGVVDAKTSQKSVCTQLLLLNGTLNVSSIIGNRVAYAKITAQNRTLAAGVSAKTALNDSGRVSNVTLHLSNVTYFANMTPENTPGLLYLRFMAEVTGDVVATTDASKRSNWLTVPASKVAWGTVRRMDSPLALGTLREPKPQFIGINSTLPQYCKPKQSKDVAASRVGGPAVGTSSAAMDMCNVAWMAVVVVLLTVLLVAEAG